MKICAFLVSCILQNYFVCFLLPVECELIFTLDVRTSFSFCKFGQKANVVPVHLVTYMMFEENVSVTRFHLSLKILELLCGRRGLDIQAGQNSFKAFVYIWWGLFVLNASCLVLSLVPVNASLFSLGCFKYSL